MRLDWRWMIAERTLGRPIPPWSAGEQTVCERVFREESWSGRSIETRVSLVSVSSISSMIVGSGVPCCWALVILGIRLARAASLSCFVEDFLLVAVNSKDHFEARCLA